MSGLRLADMDAREMLDVIHFFMEDDMNYSSAEQAEAKSETRSVIYRTMYGVTYKYGVKKKNRNYASDFDDEAFFESEEEEIVPFNPDAPREVKPYIPPTDFNDGLVRPFGRDIDAPLG